MKKTYRINPLAFILFLFGLTLITVSSVSAQTVDQLIESIEKLDANDRARVLEYKYSPPKRPSEEKPAAVADGPWDPSMGMRHPARPCMDRTKVPGGCGPDRRSPEQIASDPYDRNNPVSLAARGEAGADSPPPDPNGPWDKSMGMRHPARPCMKVNRCEKDIRSAAQRASDPYDTPQGRRDYCNSPAKKARECRRMRGAWQKGGVSGKFFCFAKGYMGAGQPTGCDPL